MSDTSNTNTQAAPSPSPSAPSPSAAPAPTPASAPAGAPPVSIPDRGGLKDIETPVSGDDFSGLFADNADDFGPVATAVAAGQTPPSAPQAVPASPAPATQGAVPAPPGPTPTPAPQTQTQAQPPAQPEQPAVQPPAPAAPPASEQDFDTMLAQMTEHQAALVDTVAQNFQLTQEEADLLQTDANSVVSKVAARVYVAAAANTIRQFKEFQQRMFSVLPQVIDNVVRVTATNKSIEEKFYKDFPDLADPKFKSGIITLARAYKASNPKLTSDELMRAVGIMARQQFGLAGAAPAVNPAAGVPVTQMPTGFVPAAPAAAPAIPPPSNANGAASGDNPFAGLGMDFDT